jgi:BirA family transcriptional regulator, biotin operon repressor / biotin---[acetyl-CoA-carboxylase] ligase
MLKKDRMKTISLGYPLVQLQSVDSTNSVASQFLKEGRGEEGTVILAVHQTGGRGQGNNKWISESGSNLLFSIILKPDFLPAYKQFYLSMSVAMGIRSYLSGLGIPALIKWPNDIVVNRKKLAGVLIENSILSGNLNSSVIGIGLNVNQRVFPSELPDPTSMALEAGHPFELSGTLRELLSSMEYSIQILYQGKLGEIRTAYLNQLWLMNTVAAFRDQTGTFRGRIVDIAETGELMVRGADGNTRTYGFQEVEFCKED